VVTARLVIVALGCCGNFVPLSFSFRTKRNGIQYVSKGFLASQTALGRVGVADDVGGVVAFLCSEDARWINTQRIEASGGMFL